MEKKSKVAFVCVHNSCRSQIAQALGGYYASDVFDSFSAGTILKDAINADAVRLVKEMYGIDMEEGQRPKLITDLPQIDILVTMGCNVSCPSLKADHQEDWGLTDPTGLSDPAFIQVITSIDKKIKDLRDRLKAGRLKA